MVLDECTESRWQTMSVYFFECTWVSETDNEGSFITQQNFPHMDPVHWWEGKPLAESAQFLNICKKKYTIK